MTGRTLPNVLYIGLARAGSTWLSEVLRLHPDVFVPEVKDLYFFDREWDRGVDWYARWFEPGADHTVRMEFSHDYLHVPFVPDRVHQVVPDARFLVTLREPVSWVLSNYQNMRRNGSLGGDVGWVISRHVGLVASGLYGPYLRRWLQRFDRDRFAIHLFDDLQADPAAFHEEVLLSLGLAPKPLPELEASARNESAEARWAGAARVMRAGSQAARRMGQPQLVGRLKRSKVVRQALYRPADAAGEVSEDVRSALQEFFRDDVHQLSELVDIDLVGRWGY